jgi:hypothetical protein
MFHPTTRKPSSDSSGTRSGTALDLMKRGDNALDEWATEADTAMEEAAGALERFNRAVLAIHEAAREALRHQRLN